MFIHLHAKLICTDGIGGHVVGVVLNPNHDYLTQLIVRRHLLDMVEPLVALRHITRITSDRVTVALTRQQLSTLPQRFETQPRLSSLTGSARRFSKNPTLRDSLTLSRTSRLPRNMVGVEHGMAVYAIDGFIGRIAAYKIDPRSYEIINMSVNIGPLWNRQRIQILPRMIACYRADGAQLRMPKRQLWTRMQFAPA